MLQGCCSSVLVHVFLLLLHHIKFSKKCGYLLRFVIILLISFSFLVSFLLQTKHFLLPLSRQQGFSPPEKGQQPQKKRPEAVAASAASGGRVFCRQAKYGKAGSAQGVKGAAAPYYGTGS